MDGLVLVVLDQGLAEGTTLMGKSLVGCAASRQPLSEPPVSPGEV